MKKIQFIHILLVLTHDIDDINDDIEDIDDYNDCINYDDE